ncbi:GNAT family N-acetyltransferase [Arundinibacter roseus]|uniref:GNAT family N-acetyltransferase n=1 Tax=Arundinibacter roseus TaxID=2070510 RepID=A0A4R4K065_9BACT|nr:GNAT family N-acetyltransferase [Arundinibacter roseus]TDB59842.1 GNAT family N-acetyltransferase [Arundinibacter roseus]
MHLFTIRQATVADAPTLAQHRADMWLAMNDLSPEGYDEMYRQSVSYFEEAVADASFVGWLAEAESGEIIAGGGLLLRRIAPFPGADKRVCHSEKQAHILNVYTEPAYRGRGLANSLMHHMMAWCEAQQIALVTLNASTAGKPMYEKLGFEEVRNYMKWNQISEK